MKGEVLNCEGQDGEVNRVLLVEWISSRVRVERERRSPSFLYNGNIEH